MQGAIQCCSYPAFGEERGPFQIELLGLRLCGQCHECLLPCRPPIDNQPRNSTSGEMGDSTDARRQQSCRRPARRQQGLHSEIQLKFDKLSSRRARIRTCTYSKEILADDSCRKLSAFQEDLRQPLLLVVLPADCHPRMRWFCSSIG